MRLTPRYRPGEKIGERFLVHQALMGGMGEVYLCFDLENRVPLALKTFQERFLSNQRLRDAFKTEVKTWIALGVHPNIVSCFVMEIVENQPFMHLEWIPGEEGRGNDLRGWLSGETLPPRLALQFAIDICNGLVHAGARQPGIVHRDIKPENILVAIGRVAMLTDWGLAKLVQETNLHVPVGGEVIEGRKSLVGAGGVVGTPSYMAPEQWLNDELDARTDIYAVGCVLYEMLTGKQPYQGTTFDELCHKHLEAALPELPAGVGPHSNLNQLLARCLAKRKDERFSEVGSLLGELSRLYREQFGEEARVLRGEDEITVSQLHNSGMTYHQLELYDEALAHYTRAIKLDPDNGKIRTTIGNTYFRLGRFDEALAEHNRAIELDPLDVKAYSNRGNTLAEMKRYEEAITDFTRAIQLAPRLAFHLTNRGVTYQQMRRYEEALADFAEAIRNSPREVIIYLNRGNTYMLMGRYEEALGDLTRALTLDPGSAKAYMVRSKVYGLLNRYDDCLSDLKQVINFDSTYEDAYVGIVLLLHAQGSGPEFEHYFQQAVRRFGQEKIVELIIQTIPEEENRPGAWEAHGLMLVQAEAWEGAIRCFDRAILLDPQSVSPLLNKGTALHLLKRYDEALECFERVIAIRPDNVMAWHNKGNTLGITGRYSEALECFQKALLLDPSYGPSQQAMMQAKSLLRRQSPGFQGPTADRGARQDSAASACPRCGLPISLEPFERYRKMGVSGGRLQCPRCGTVLFLDFESGRATVE